MLNVNVLCRNYKEDRVIPRFSWYLADNLGWTLTQKPDTGADLIYLSGYFEAQLLRPWPDCKTAAYFTHLETAPRPDNPKAKLFHQVSKQVDLRIVTAEMYGKILMNGGPTVQIPPPVERHRFTIPKRRNNKRLTVGFSGYSYSNGRKGEKLARELINSTAGKSVDWRASGRGWPVPTAKYNWSDMPDFFQSLDILVVTATVEGNPMPPLEVMACGGSVVIPRGVGLLDELPDAVGIHRYKCGNAKDAVRALGEAIKMRPEANRQGLRAITEPYTITNWCEMHRQAFEELF
jgi:hypothetical protein